MIAMKIDYKQILKLIWTLLSVAILLLHFDSCFLMPDGCFAAGNEMLGLMSLISFPGSLLYLLFLSLSFTSTNVYLPAPYFLLWGGAFIVGYVQWFVVVPYLFQQSNRITTLGLAQSGASIVGGTGGKRATRSRRKRRRVAWLRGARVIHFDDTGRTPLERVIKDHHI